MTTRRPRRSGLAAAGLLTALTAGAALLPGSVTKAQTYGPEAQIAPGTRVQLTPGIPGRLNVLAGVNAQTGETVWVMPADSLKDLISPTDPLGGDIVEQMLAQGFVIQALSEPQQGSDIVIVALRQP